MSHTVLHQAQSAAAVWNPGGNTCCRFVHGVADAIRHATVRLKTGLGGLSTSGCAMALLVGLATFGVGRADAALVRHLNADGQIIGASGVVVNGLSYDVSFQAGTCIDVFGGCSSDSLGPFLSEVDARRASAALLGDVFVDVAEGAFGTNPALTCYPFGGLCLVFTPYLIDDEGYINSAVVYNQVSDANDFVGGNRMLTPDDNLRPNSISSAVWAVWTAQGSAVPEPGTLTLLAAAGLALVWTRRRRAPSTPGKLTRLTPHIRPAAGT